MYSKPQLEKFGTFRELTQIGFRGVSDGLSIPGIGTGNTCSSFGIGCPAASTS
jgi:hypothetical protein